MQIFNFDKNDQIMYSKEIKSHQIIHLECLTIWLRHRARALNRIKLGQTFQA